MSISCLSLAKADLRDISKCYISDTTHAGTPKRPVRILYLVPDIPGQAFWDTHVSFMSQVAESLGIELYLDYIEPKDRSRFYIKDRIHQTLEGIPKPDFVVGHFYLAGEKIVLSVFEALQIPFFSLNTSITNISMRTIGLPREKFNYWLGHMSPDDYQAGYKLAKYLTQDESNKAVLAGVAGTTDSTVSRNREDGLLLAAKESNSYISQIFHTDWTPSSSIKVTNAILRRYPDVNIIWTVSNSLADGVIQALIKKGFKPGERVKIGSMDWSPIAINMVRSGLMDVSFGGHYTEGGWALILLLDYANKIDFKNELGTMIETQLKPLHKGNVNQYAERILNFNWHDIDFKKKSKCFNQTLKHYDFDVEAILN